MRGVSPQRRKVKGHAVNSTPGSSRRGWYPPVAGESVHSNAGIHQVNFEWRGGHRCCPVATERFWTLSFPFANPRWNVKDDVTEISQHTRQTSAPKEIL